MAAMRTALLCTLSSILILSVSPSFVAADGSAMDFVRSTIDQNPVVVFSKSYCPYCSRAKEVLRKIKADPFVVELDQRSDGRSIQEAVSELVGRHTVPQVRYELTTCQRRCSQPSTTYHDSLS